MINISYEFYYQKYYLFLTKIFSYNFYIIINYFIL